MLCFLQLFFSSPWCSNAPQLLLPPFGLCRRELTRLYLDDPKDCAAEVLEKSGWVGPQRMLGPVWAPPKKTLCLFSWGPTVFLFFNEADSFVELILVDEALRQQWPSMPSWRQSPSGWGRWVLTGKEFFFSSLWVIERSFLWGLIWLSFFGWLSGGFYKISDDF